jgi:hypothetical protein
MITLLRDGSYKLIETATHTKVLYLNNDIYAWTLLKEIGEILVHSHRVHRADRTVAMGHFNLYDVSEEPALSDLQHLELEISRGAWQGYLLLTGLPDVHKKRARIVATKEIITGNPRFAGRSDISRVLAKEKMGTIMKGRKS